MKEVLGLIAVLFEFASIAVYYNSIIHGRTKPHLYTFLVWSIVASIVFAGQWVSGAGAGSWATGVSALFLIGTVLLSFKFGTTDITRSDGIALFAALAAIVPWAITNNPLWSVILAAIIDACAIIPTFRKTWNNAYSESVSSWVLAEG